MDLEFSSDGSKLTTAAGKSVTVFASDGLDVLSSRALETELECASLCPNDPSRVVVGGVDMWLHVLEVGGVLVVGCVCVCAVVAAERQGVWLTAATVHCGSGRVGLRGCWVTAHACSLSLAMRWTA